MFTGNEWKKMSYITKGSIQFRKTTIALFLASFCTYANLWNVQPLLPKFIEQFDLTHTGASLAVSVGSVSLAIGLLVSGFFSESIDRKTFMGVSMALVTFCSLGIVFASSFEILLVFRMLLGVSLAGIPAIALAYIGEEFHPNILGRVTGFYIGGTALGGLSGRLISSLVADFSSWRVSIFVMTVLSTVSCMIFFLTLPKSKHFHKEKAEVKKMFGYMLFHLKNECTLLVFLLGFIVMGAFVAFFNYVTFYLSEPPFEWSKWLLGWMYILYIFGSYSSSYFGKLGDQKPRYITAALSIFIMILGFLLTFIQSSWIVLFGMILIIIGFFGAHSTCSAWVGKVASDHKSQASSLYLFFYYMGSSMIGTVSGFFYGTNGWLGIVVFLLFILGVALFFVWRLYRLLQKNH